MQQIRKSETQLTLRKWVDSKLKVKNVLIISIFLPLIPILFASLIDRDWELLSVSVILMIGVIGLIGILSIFEPRWQEIQAKVDEVISLMTPSSIEEMLKNAVAMINKDIGNGNEKLDNIVKVDVEALKQEVAEKQLIETNQRSHLQ